MRSALIVDEETHTGLTEACDALVSSTQARGVFLIDRNGLLITHGGDADDVDGIALASLAAGNMAATNGIASLLGEDEFGALIHQGERESVHISLLGERMILVVLFDGQSSLGLVRLRVDQVREGFEKLLEEMLNRSAEHDRTLEAEMTGEDIDNLLRDA